MSFRPVSGDVSPNQREHSHSPRRQWQAQPHRNVGSGAAVMGIWCVNHWPCNDGRAIDLGYGHVRV